MARMSIDDAFLRDPRVLRLGRRMNVSKWDARGRVLEVFGLVYDRIDDTLTIADVDTAAEHDGFGALMIEVGLADSARGEKIRVRGATDRIKYLRESEETGRAGGLKSAEVRRNKAKGPSNAPLNTPLEGAFERSAFRPSRVSEPSG